MGDRFSMNIRIGGDPGEHRAELDALIEEHNGTPDEDNGTLLVCLDFEQSANALDEMKDTLRSWGLSYDHLIEAKYEFDAVIQYWRPGMDQEAWVVCLNTGEQVITFETLHKLIDEGMTPDEIFAKYEMPSIPDFVFSAEELEPEIEQARRLT